MSSAAGSGPLGGTRSQRRGGKAGRAAKGLSLLLSLLFHLTGVAVAGGLVAPSAELPSVELQDIVGVEVRSEPTAQQNAPRRPEAGRPDRERAAKSPPRAAVSSSERQPAPELPRLRPQSDERHRREERTPEPSRDEVSVVPARSAEKARRVQAGDSEPPRDEASNVPASSDEQARLPSPSTHEASVGDTRSSADESSDEHSSDSTGPRPEVPPPGLLAVPEQLFAARGDHPALPDGSIFALFVRTAAIRRSPNATAARRLMRAVVGYELYLGRSAFDPITDFDWMSVRTPDPSQITETRIRAGLAVEPERARAAVARIVGERGTLIWQLPEEGSERATLSGASGRWRRMAWGLVHGDETLYLAGPRSWVSAALHRQGQGSPLEGELAEVTIDGAPADVVLAAPGLGPIFGTGPGRPDETLVVAARLDDEPVAVGRLWVGSEGEARRIVRFVRVGVERFVPPVLFGDQRLGRLLRGIRVARQGATVTAWVRLERSDVEALLQMAGRLSRGREVTGRRGGTNRIDDPRGQP